MYQPLGFSSYISQYSFQVSSISNVFYGPSQKYGTTFNTPPSTYNLPPSGHSSLPTQMHDMDHEDEKEDNDNNNTNNNDEEFPQNRLWRSYGSTSTRFFFTKTCFFAQNSRNA